ncbi:hypothetical protein GCM10010404_24510 [Nonomuraea africana]
MGGVLRQPEERGELGIGQNAEEVDDARGFCHGGSVLREHNETRSALWYRVHCSVKVRPHSVNPGDSLPLTPTPGLRSLMTREGWLYREDPGTGMIPPDGPGRPAFI